tara:strand:+ start:726 stop:1136 length:411 start_codon:yes stop_codon:yes gene_type:complete
VEKLRQIKQICFNYDKVIFLAANDISEELSILNACEVEATAIDYDPKFKDTPNYINKDFVFDDVELDADLIVHMNCEKTYPVKLKGDVILRGDNEAHNGDCSLITSCEQLIKMYNIEEVYSTRETDTHYFVYGRAA